MSFALTSAIAPAAACQPEAFDYFLAQLPFLSSTEGLLRAAIGVSILIQYTAALIWGKQYISMPELISPINLQFGGKEKAERLARLLQQAIILCKGGR